MLVLSRKNGQNLIIDDKIEIVVIESSYNAVKLGIVAPKDVTVLREEIYREIIKNNNGAKQTSVASLNQLNTLFEKKKIVKNEFKD